MVTGSLGVSWGVWQSGIGRSVGFCWLWGGSSVDWASFDASCRCWAGLWSEVMEVGTRTWALCRIPQGILKQLLRCRATNEPAGWRPLPPSGAVGKGLVDWCVRVTSTCIQEPNVPQQKIVSWWLLSVHLSKILKTSSKDCRLVDLKVIHLCHRSKKRKGCHLSEVCFVEPTSFSCICSRAGGETK